MYLRHLRLIFYVLYHLLPHILLSFISTLLEYCPFALFTNLFLTIRLSFLFTFQNTSVCLSFILNHTLVVYNKLFQIPLKIFIWKKMLFVLYILFFLRHVSGFPQMNGDHDFLFILNNETIKEWSKSTLGFGVVYWWGFNASLVSGGR